MTVEERGEVLVRGRVAAGAVAARDEGILVRRARLEDADEVLERSLTGGHGLGRANRIGHVPIEGDA